MKMKPNIAKAPFLKGHENFVEESYLQFLSEIREDINEGHESDHLSPDFQDEFRGIIFREELNQYHPLKFYWLNLIDKLVDTLALIEEELDEPSDLIGVFSESDLLGYVIERLEEEVEVEQIFEEILDMQELQIISFFYLHLSKDEWIPSGPVSYRIISEIGEGFGHLFLGEEHTHYSIEELRDEVAIPIVSYQPADKTLQVLIDDNVKIIRGDTLHKVVEGINIFPGISEDGQVNFNHLEKVTKGIDTIKNLCPNLFVLLNKYTQNIVPIYQDELVSFSMATLPGYSSINMSNRDFVDMVDDLLHENGHHFLNAILEGEEEVLFEDDQKIFFSPWRRSLRPIRGLYHAVITFYWAYRLFKELTCNGESPKTFSQDEIEKIHIRFLEEAELIRQCEDELNTAYKLEKVSEFGKEISDQVLSEIEQDKELEENTFNSLKEEAKAELKKQFDLVEKARLA